MLNKFIALVSNNECDLFLLFVYIKFKHIALCKPSVHY